ncbi:MAG: T9SS type A sorting domain-containing protein [Marinilabiliaceae bacterium]|nr:T9SS type A sorting domain-containing protein [Marinilabiliaceae bacterium]
MVKSYLFQNQRVSRFMRMSLILCMTLFYGSRTAELWAQPTFDPPFTANGDLKLFYWTSTNVYLQFPFYDTSSGGYERFIAGNANKLEYSTNGGQSYTSLLNVKGGGQEEASWYWIDMQKAAASFTLYSVAQEAGYGEPHDWNTIGPINEGPGSNWKRVKYKNNKLSSTRPHTCYAAIRWENLPSTVQNSVITFRIEGTLDHEDRPSGVGSGTRSISWVCPTAYVYGNPLNTPQIGNNAHEFQANGTVKINYSIPNFNNLADKGTKYVSDVILEMPSKNLYYHENEATLVSYGQKAPKDYISSGNNLSFESSYVLTKAEMNDGITFQIMSTRYDHAMSNPMATHPQWGQYMYKRSNVYTVPAYRQPNNLSVSLTGGKVKLSWTMDAGTNGSPTDGYNIQWRVAGDTWQDVSGGIKPYVASETNPFIEFDYPEINVGIKTYEFRVKRAGLNWGLYEATQSAVINTSYVNINSIIAQANSSGITLNWTLTEGVIKNSFKFRITRNQTVVLTSALDITTLTFTDSSVPSCESSTYLIEIIDGATVIGSKASSPISRPASDPGTISEISASKGFYNDRVSITWNTAAFSGSGGASFNRYTVSRRQADNPNAIDQQIYEIQGTGLSQYSYDDNTAIPGIYYTYTIRGWMDCSGDSEVASEIESIGFMQPYGVVSGRIAYTGSIAVKDVKVAATGESGYKNKAFAVSDSSIIRVPYKEDLTPDKFTFQAWFKGNLITSKEQWLYNSDWRYGVKIVNNKLQFDHCHNNPNGTGTTYFRSNFNYLLLQNEYQHITITSNIINSQIETKLYINGELKETVTGTINGSIGFPSGNYTTIGAGENLQSSLSGFVDEVRVWNRVLSAEEIANNYDRYISGQEDALQMYFRFDETSGNTVFDISGNNGVFNENHGTIYGGNSAFRTEFEVPDTEQLAIKAVTDENGYYIINTIPYSGNGTTYTISPMLGVHDFEPANRPLYFSSNSSTHNGIDFTDVSSFKVEGYVTYEGGTYPVADCNFELDGRTMTNTNGSVLKSNDEGYFDIRIPIGIHSLRVVKQGHTFENDGYLQELVFDTETGEEFYKDLNYIAPISNIQFYDQTRIKLIGRVTGGATENNKISGFGESINNIGAQTIKLENTLPQYNLTNDTFSETFTHNQGQWTSPGGLQDDQTIVTYNQQDITIQVSPITGEFVAMVYPEPYIISDIRVPADYGALLTIYNLRETLDLVSAVVPDNSFLRTNIRTWADSLFVTGIPGMVDHWEYFENSDTVFYNAEWKYYYQSTPSFSVKQLVTNQPVDYFGDISFEVRNELTDESDDLELYNETDGYLFGKPVFRQGNQYIFGMNAYEEYTNYVSDPIETVRYPIKNGKVNMSNDIQFNPMPDLIETDDNGEVKYAFIAGAPNLTTGSNNFFATLMLGNVSYYWDLGTEPIEAWHLGDRTTGTDFMTAGPDEVDIILRDPPGSKSKSFIENGTSVTVKKTSTIVNGAKEAIEATLHLGTKVITWTGVGAGVITEAETVIDVTAGIKAEETWTSASERTTKTTFTERFETSDDNSYVSHYGDIFIGNSTNILYGLTNAITILKNYSNEDNDAFETVNQGDNDYSIAPANSLAFGQTFDTRFAYTQVDLETIMLPKWREGLSLLIKPMGTEVNSDIIEEPIYVSNLPHNHPNFGKLNTDDVAFGTNASPPDLYYTGPSYTTYFPNEYDWTKFETDSVTYFNNQIDGWTEILAQNEKEKVEMKLIDNYSFGSGVSIQYSATSTATESYTKSFKWVLNPTLLYSDDGQVLGLGMGTKVGVEYVHEDESSSTEETETSINSGFVLQEEGGYDQLTVDYGMTTSGTFAFKTRGGRTSCPYEDELRTKYYQPGVHVLNEATMQIEVPKIRVDSSPVVLNVPDNREAIFTLALENESETSDDFWFQLIVEEATNPHGAILKIDGGAIGNGRSFLVKPGETLYKTLTVGKGTEDIYQNIALVLRSQCQGDPTDFLPVIADTAYISVEFITGVSNVAITEPSNNWILNTDNPTSDTLYVSIADYDVNFPNFGYIRLEYRPIASPNWNTIMTFYPSHLYEKAQGLKEDIGTRPFIVYPWKMPAIDGQYEIRATVTSVNAIDGEIIGNPLSTYSTDALSGYKDLTLPRSLGAPSPANGILGAGDELSITFNEDIQTGMLTQNNFTISGILNAQEIAEPNVGLSFTGGSQHSKTEMPIFVDGSFSIETWFYRDLNSAGTLFAFGNNEKYISLGFNAAGNCILKIGNETYSSTITIANDETWKYISMSYDRENNSVSVFELEGVLNNNLFTNQQLTLIPENQGRLFVGNNFDFNDGFNGAISHLHFYAKIRTMADISAEKNIRKSGREHGLIGYWLLDEAEGSIAEDKARSRHLMLQNDWYIYPSGYAKQTDNNYFNIQTATYPLDIYRDFTLEFWFRSENNSIQNGATLFSADNGYIAITSNGGVALYKAEGTLNQTLISENVNDTKWHHFALSVRRNGSVNVYINGENRSVFAENQLGSFASAFYCFGAKRTNNAYSQYFNGYFDEIRIWNSALPRENIILNKNSKLHGDESGLLAYYPFETYVHQSSGLIVVMQSNDNMVDEGATTATGTATTSSVSVPVKDVRPIENVPFSFVASNNKIVLTMSPDYFTRVEGTILNISVKDIRDMRNNKSGTEQWTAFVRRNALLWDSDPININMQEGENVTFTARIINTGGTMTTYSIENLPVWLSVNNSVGNLQPLQSRDLTFTVFQGINIGNYETAIELDCGNGVTEILPMQLKVTGLRPNWYVNPSDYESSMSIIGQVRIENIISNDENDMVGAFIDGVCVGVTSPKYMTNLDRWQASLNVYYSTENKSIEFRIWHAGSGKIYAPVKPLDINFRANTLVGTPSNPIIFETTGQLLNIVPLVTGWNWISFNVNSPSLENANLIMRGVNNGIEIKSQQSFSRFENGVWTNGTLNDRGFNNLQMYMIKMSGNNEISLAGEDINPETTQISLMQGWNWIAYTPQFNNTVNEAFAGLNATAGDIIKGQFSFAVYDNQSGWVGSLEYLQPNAGYMYKAAQARTFNYPGYSTIASMPPKMGIPKNEIAHKYENNLTIIGEVLLNDAEISESAMLVAKINGQERGRSLIRTVNEKQLFFLTVHADGKDEIISFYLFDSETETPLSQIITFKTDATLGTLDNPILFTNDGVNFSVYPNPTSGQFFVRHCGHDPQSPQHSGNFIEIFDAVGRLVHHEPFTVNRATIKIDISHLENGLYFVKIGNETVKIVKN